MKTLTLRAVRATPGSGHVTLREYGLEPGASEQLYRRKADQWQQDFDQDADPVRVYVIDGDGAAIYAAGATQRHRRQERPERGQRNTNTTSANSGGI